MTKQRPRRARVLTNVCVEEVSVVDKGAGEGCHIMIRKRDGKPDYEAFFGRIFGVKKRIHDGYPMPDMGKNLDVPVDPPRADQSQWHAAGR